jgi:hypothetical protein
MYVAWYCLQNVAIIQNKSSVWKAVLDTHAASCSQNMREYHIHLFSYLEIFVEVHYIVDKMSCGCNLRSWKCIRLRTVFVFRWKVRTQVKKQDIFTEHRPNVYLLEDCISMGRNVTDMTATEVKEREWQFAISDVIFVITNDDHWPHSPMMSHEHLVVKLLSYISLPQTV